MEKLLIWIKLGEKSNFTNFPMLKETVSGHEGIKIASDTINNPHQLTPI
jgi:hypothetical protein